MRKYNGLLIIVFLLFSCQESTLPKPKAYLNLSYPKTNYKQLELKRPFTFSVSTSSLVKDEQKNWLKIEYPQLKASINITYIPVQNNLNQLILESEKLVFKHTQKADKISPKDFINQEKRVFGSFYEISGDAASQIQFHLTDSTKHFIKAALYFNTKPNYDSILPAIDYIRNDVLELIETFKWID